MSLNNQVVWSEGLFLRPQHFQQQDRHHHRELLTHMATSVAYRYGLIEYSLDTELLKFGKLGLATASGIFEDGTYFDLPEQAPLPLAIDIPDDFKDGLVCVILPAARRGMPDTALGEGSTNSNTQTSIARYRASDQEVGDNIIGRDNMTPMKVAQLNLALELDSRVGSAFVKLPIAHVVEKRPDGRVVLNEDFIPICVNVRASRRLIDMAREVQGLLRHRASVLAQRVAQPGSKGVAEFADFLLLQVCNRFTPLFSHLIERTPLNPEFFYQQLLMLAGELSTFGRNDRRCPDFPIYRHNQPQLSFAPVLDEVRRTLTAVVEQTAVSIALQDRGRGVFTAEVNDISLIREASFVLAANADLNPETLRTGLPQQLKIGPPDKIRDLVLSQLSGIAVRPLPVAPRQIPYHAGYTYFELDRTSEFWKGIEVSRVIAMHIAGEFPGLTLEFWAIRDR